MQKQEPKTRRGDIKNYILEAEIGHGASGVCYKAISKSDGSVCAIKKISINSIKGNSLKVALKEVQVLKQLKHPNIIQYYDSFTDQGYLYIVMEYASKGDLHTTLKRRKIKQQFYSETEIWDMAKQLLEALKYLHSKNIVHRDFKTLNIFIGEKNNLLVGDLGVSKIIKNDMGLYSRVGTPLYLAPEIIKYEKYDYKADVWGFGCVIYIMSALSHPFQGKNIINLGQNILHSEPKLIANYSNELNLFLKGLLEKNPLKRPEAKFLLSQYFSPEVEKHRKQVLQQKAKLKFEQQQKQKQKFRKTNTFIENASFKKIEKIIPKFSTEMELKQKKNSQKKVEICDEKQVNCDQTIILQPSCSKIDTPQQKTRIRTMFNNSKSRIVSNKAIVDDSHMANNPKVIQPKPKQDTEHEQIKQVDSQYLGFYRSKQDGQKEKVATQAHEILKKGLECSFLKQRNIQSAKPRAEQSSKGDLYSSCERIQKQFVISSVNRMFFQSDGEKEDRKVTTRPKSSLGRKTLIGSTQIKYVKRRNTSQEQSLSQTKTQLLRKPEMIII